MAEDYSGLVRWLFADRATGRLVIAQAPNLLMWVLLASLATTFVVPPGPAANAVGIVQVTSLALWAFDELTRGVNPWRRFLGLATLAGIVAWLLLRR